MAKLLKKSFLNCSIGLSKVVFGDKNQIFSIYYSKSIVLGKQESEEKEKMISTRSKYFQNDLPDYQGQSINISKEKWQRFILEKANKCYTNQPANAENADGGLYVGVSGLAYMFYHLSQSDQFEKESEHLLSNALAIIKFCEKYVQKTHPKKKQSEECGFLLGSAGTYAIAAAIYNRLGDEENSEKAVSKYVGCAEICLPPIFVSFGGDEFLVGRAGYLAGALWLNRELGRQAVPLEKMHEVCTSIIEYGRWYSKTYNHRCPLMYSYYKTEYLGAAHGLSSILQMLLTVDEYLDCKQDVERDVKASVDYLLSLQTPDGNFPCAMDEIEPNQRPTEEALIHWCHGAPGVVYLMARAYLRWQEPKYLESCKRCADLTWDKGLLKKGPGICHGVTGNGYVLLLLYRLTQDPKYLHRANQFALFLESPRFKEARTPDSPYSLYEGWAGAVLFLCDLLTPSKAAFPFMDVFYGNGTQ